MVSQICYDCGVKHLTEEQKKNPRAITFWEGKCSECGEKKMVTNDRHYKR